MKLIISALMLLSLNALANNETSFLCKRNSKGSCVERLEKSLEKLDCQPILESVVCEDAATSPSIDPEYAQKLKGKDLCKAQSLCDEPRYDLMGNVSCQAESVNLKNADRGITLTTSVGLFRKYVTTLCK